MLWKINKVELREEDEIQASQESDLLDGQKIRRKKKRKNKREKNPITLKEPDYFLSSEELAKDRERYLTQTSFGLEFVMFSSRYYEAKSKYLADHKGENVTEKDLRDHLKPYRWQDRVENFSDRLRGIEEKIKELQLIRGKMDVAEEKRKFESYERRYPDLIEV